MNTTNRVAINTVIQYSRLVINLVVALVTVRIILNALGTSDYGIYDVVAGVVALLGFLQSSLAQTSVRYLSVSLGKNDITDTRLTFNNCFWLHLLIAIALVAILEIVGLFLFDGFLNIPPERIRAAKVVYQSMTFTLFFHVFSTPFCGLIVSHEKFLFSSLVSIMDSFLKLGIACYLIYTQYDKLVVYGVLMASVAIINTFLYWLYDRIKYSTELYVGTPTFKGIMQQSSFAGWTILDVLGSVATRQGYSVMLNKFFGTGTNAVFAIARQVEGQVYNISAAVIDTMKPQIMKSYGAKDKNRMLRLSMTAGKFGFSLMSVVAIPLLIMMPEVLDIWLKNVPEGTILFARLLILACMSEQLTRGIVYACQATGKIKWFSITISLIRFSALPISIGLLSTGLPSYIAIIVFLICETLGSLSRVFIMSYLEGLRINTFFSDVLFRILPPFVAGLLLCYYLKTLTTTILGNLIVIVVTVLVYLLLFYFIGLNNNERLSINNIISSSIKKHVIK